MKPFTTDEIRQAIHGRWLATPTTPQAGGTGGGGSAVVERVCIDSRRAAMGELFIAIRGERHDGHAFLADAAAAGCSAAVVERGATLDPAVLGSFSGGVIGVADTTVALGELAGFHRRSLPGQVVAVTGTVGKSTVKEMIHHILAKRFRGTAARGSFNNAIGVPLTLLAAAVGDDYVVCELGTNAPGEIETLSRIARADLCVVTAVGLGHLQGLGDIDRIAVEKASILTWSAPRAAAVVNGDNRLLLNALKCYDRKLVTFGVGDGVQLRLTDYRPTEGGGEFQLNGRLWVRLGLLGRHNAMNALAAMAVAMRFGFSAEAAAEALADFTGVAMRMEVHHLSGGVTLINDAYNANPTSMAAALETLAGLNAPRRALVIGDMLELGERAEQLHEQLGRDIAARGVAGLLVCVGPLAGCAGRAAAAAGMDSRAILTYDSARDAAEAADQWLCDGDAVLVKASRAVGAEAVVQALLRRDDAAAAARPT